MKTQSMLEWRRNRQGYLFILPWIIGFLAFGLIPMVSSAWISLLRWDGLGDPEFVGFQNYINLTFPASGPTLRSELFWRSLGNNVLFMIFSCFGGIMVAVFLAAIMHEKIPGHQAWRVLFFLPSLVVPVAFGLMMVPIFLTGTGSLDSPTGLLNWLILFFGGEEVNFLGDPKVAVWTLIITNYWFIGGGMVIFMAAIAGVPKSYYEAAQLDGAGWWRRFFSVTVPLIAPIIFFQVVMALIAGLRVFDLAASLAQLGASTSSNMGSQNSLATLVFYLYKRGWKDWRMGEAAALGWIVFLLGLVFTVAIIVYLRQRQGDEVGGIEEV